MKLRWSLFSLLFFLIPLSVHAAGQKILAGVASNFILPLNEITGLFEKQTGIKVEPVFSSSGKLYAQIKSGAPYDIFLAADEERPARLFQEGFVRKPFVYARGQVVLWFVDKRLCSAKNWVAAVRSTHIKKLAVANPEAAPYGASAMAAFKEAGLDAELKDKLVFSQDIGQAFQYASTGSVDACICARSSALSDEGKKGCWFPVDRAPKVVQYGCVLTNAPCRKAAEQFAAFLLHPDALRIKEKYGYE